MLLDNISLKRYHNILFHKTTLQQDVPIIFILFTVLLLVFGWPLQELHLLIGLFVTEIVLLVVPTLLYAVWYHHPLKATFSLAPIRFKAVWLTIVTTVAAFVLVMGVGVVQEFIRPRSQEYQQLLEQMLRQFHQIPFPVTFGLIAMLPGICEEFLFRGLLLCGLRGKFSDGIAIVLAGILFGIFHLDPYRVLPVTLLGILFGYMVVKTGSIFTGMIAHMTNNGIAISLSYFALKFQDQIPVESSPSDVPEMSPILTVALSIVAIAVAVVVFIAGLRALPKATEEAGKS